MKPDFKLLKQAYLETLNNNKNNLISNKQYSNLIVVDISFCGIKLAAMQIFWMNYDDL